MLKRKTEKKIKEKNYENNNKTKKEILFDDMKIMNLYLVKRLK
jgi:hypothetical protein